MDIIDETGTFYVDNFEYKFNGCDPEVYILDKVYNSEGYADRLATMNGPYYNYYRHDHLGDNREVWQANTNTTIQSAQYYPSGLPWSEGTGQDIQNRKYNGKEFVEMHGYDTYDYGARGMYPAIGRFMTVDPLAELTPGISPYAYCKGNPISRIDPTGMYSTEEWKTDNGYTDGDFLTIYKAPDENNKQEKQQNDPSLINAFTKEFLNYFGWDLNPDDPKDRKKIDEGSKNRVNAAEQIKEANKFLIINGVLFFVGEGAAYCIEEFGGAIIVKLISKEAIQAAEQGTTVLGKFPEYMNLASEYGARRFSVPTNIWNKMSEGAQWIANQKFLDRLIARGDKIILSNPVSNINKVTGAFRKELDYLIENGYRLNSNGTQLIPIK